jgi:hypothetical protein
MSLIEDPTEEQLKKLELNGDELFKRVVLDSEFQPVLIEFAGSPKSGKSTNLTMSHLSRIFICLFNQL